MLWTETTGEDSYMTPTRDPQETAKGEEDMNGMENVQRVATKRVPSLRNRSHSKKVREKT